jgi:ADP-ribosylglycohydrolase
MAVDRHGRALASLHGLALGDAFGSLFMVRANRSALLRRRPPPGPWQWSGDTEMACSVFAVLRDHGRIDQEALAASFVSRYDPARGYGPVTDRMLRLLRAGASWRVLAAGLLQGTGSWGSEAAMRVAPVGAWFAEDLEEVAREAVLSAEVTHVHPEGVAGAVAVAVAAAVGVSWEGSAARFLESVLEWVPAGAVYDGILAGRELDLADARSVAAALGNGSRVSARDTVPFALWVASHQLDDFREALWACAEVGGDVDTTSAIVGGVLGARAGLPGLPQDWMRAREQLPQWLGVPSPFD